MNAGAEQQGHQHETAWNAVNRFLDFHVSSVVCPYGWRARLPGALAVCANVRNALAQYSIAFFSALDTLEKSS
jgi:hypothetical protein